MRMRNFVKGGNDQIVETEDGSVEDSIQRDDYNISAAHMHGGNHGDLGSMRKTDADQILETYPTEID